MAKQGDKLTRRAALKGIFLASAGALALLTAIDVFGYFKKPSPSVQTSRISPTNPERVNATVVLRSASTIDSRTNISDPVTIKVVYFGMSDQMTGTKEEYFTLQTPAFLQDLISLIEQRHVVFATMLPTMQIVVDGVPTQDNPQLQSKTEVDFIPLYAGG